MWGVVSCLIMVLQPMRLRYSPVITSTNKSRSVDIVRHAPHSFNCRWGHARSRSVTAVGLPRLSRCTLRRHCQDYFRIRHRKEEQRWTVQFDGLGSRTRLFRGYRRAFCTHRQTCRLRPITPIATSPIRTTKGTFTRGRLLTTESCNLIWRECTRTLVLSTRQL